MNFKVFFPRRMQLPRATKYTLKFIWLASLEELHQLKQGENR